MRLLAIALLGLLAATTAGHAQNVDPDGFSICSFTSSGGGLAPHVLGPCQPLTEQTMQVFGLSASQITLVRTLRTLAAVPSPDQPPQLTSPSLAAPKAFAAVGAFSDYWFADTANPGKLDLGVHLRYVTEDAKPRLFQMTYAVDDGRFSVLWNRALASQHR